MLRLLQGISPAHIVQLPKPFGLHSQPFLFPFSVCAAGYEGAASPGSGCTQCPAGKFKAAAGNAACGNCNAGHSSSAPFTSCDDCQADEYNPTAGGTCQACATPSETTDGQTGQKACGKKNRGFESVMPD